MATPMLDFLEYFSLFLGKNIHFQYNEAKQLKRDIHHEYAIFT